MYGYFDTILMFLRYIWAAPDHFLLALPLNKKCCISNVKMVFCSVSTVFAIFWWFKSYLLPFPWIWIQLIMINIFESIFLLNLLKYYAKFNPRCLKVIAFLSFLLHDYVSWTRNKDLSLSKQTLQIMDKLWHYFHNHLDNLSMILKYKFLRVRMNLPFVKSFCFNCSSNIYLTYLFYEVISTLHVHVLGFNLFINKKNIK